MPTRKMKTDYVYACDFCGCDFPDESMAEDHELDCMCNPKVRVEKSIFERGCQSCRHLDAEGYRSTDCPRHGEEKSRKPITDCKSWVIAKDLYWGLPGYLQQVIPPELRPYT
jgi:methionyl-tRNA synthetase